MEGQKDAKIVTKIVTAVMDNGYQAWLKKNKRLLGLLRLDANQAFLHRAQVDVLSIDLKEFAKKHLAVIVVGVVLLLALLIIHTSLVRDTVKCWYLVAYFLGLFGAFVASYGFLFHLRGIVTAEAPSMRMLRFPDVPHPRTSDAGQYAVEVAKCLFETQKVVVEYGNHSLAARFQQIKLEFRKQISLAVGFIMIALSCLIQLGLQFVRTP